MERLSLPLTIEDWDNLVSQIKSNKVLCPKCNTWRHRSCIHRVPDRYSHYGYGLIFASLKLQNEDSRIMACDYCISNMAMHRNRYLKIKKIEEVKKNVYDKIKLYRDVKHRFSAMENMAAMHTKHIVLEKYVGCKSCKMEPGYVYIISNDNNEYKIGSTTSSVKARVNAQKDKYNHFVHAIYTVYPRGLERYLHKKYDRYRVSGIGERERFRIGDVDVKYISSIETVNNTPVEHGNRQWLLI